MALSKTYYADFNIAYDNGSSSLNLMRSLVFGIKALLKGTKTGTNGPAGAAPGSSFWTVLGSSDGSTAGIDGTDRWTDTFDSSKLVRAAAGVAHSWVILSHATTATWLLIDLGTASDTTFNLLFSRTAFTGGSITARPTATQEYGFTTASIADTTTAVTHRLSKVTDAAGNFFIFGAKTSAGLFHTWLGHTVLGSPRTGDSHPYVAIYESSVTGRGAGTYTGAMGRSTAAAGVQARSPNGASPGDVGATTGIVLPQSSYFTVTHNNASDSLRDAFPAWFWWRGGSGTLSGTRGKLPDVGMVNAGTNPGDVSPATGDSERVVVGNFLVPNGGVIPTL